MENLIANARFEKGLRGWDSTPAGVTLVNTGRKRFVMLAGERSSAAICSDPIEVNPGGTYVVEIERTIRGDCDISILGRNSLIKPDENHEVVVSESPIRLQLTVKPGQRVGIGSVSLLPVGPRVKLFNVRSTSAFIKPGEPFLVLCEILNNGSEILEGAVARFISEHHELSEDSRMEILLPPLNVGERGVLHWAVNKQTRAFAPFEVEVEHRGGVTRTRGGTLRHVPHPPERITPQSVSGTRRWFSVSTRGLRVTAHETDYAFGPTHIGDDSGRISFGVLHHFGQITFDDRPPIPLWAEVRSVNPSGVVLKGDSSEAKWEIGIRPEHASKGVEFDIRLNVLRRLSKARIEYGPFQTLLPMHEVEITSRKGLPNSVAVLGTSQGEVNLAWFGVGGAESVTHIYPESGLMTLVTKPMNLLPGTVVRVRSILVRLEQ
ncbi:MAG TPA: hypothetical protein VNK96_07880 [Fimbriimonadales bacterium]|nr:hypothetical protein [Fimbriimonadales bacterium]